MFIKVGSIGLVLGGRKGPQGELVKGLWMSSERPEAETGPKSGYQFTAGGPDGKRPRDDALAVT
jgi:hypothetical protein